MALLLPFLILLVSSYQYPKYIPQSVLQLDIFSHLFRIVDTDSVKVFSQKDSVKVFSQKQIWPFGSRQSTGYDIRQQIILCF